MYAIYFKGVDTGKRAASFKSALRMVNRMDAAHGASAHSYKEMIYCGVNGLTGKPVYLT